MKKLSIFFLIAMLSACAHKKDIPETLANNFEVRAISANFDTPSVNLEQNHLKEILVLLHYNFPEEEINKYFGMNEDKYKNAVNDLYGEGLIKKNEKGAFIPACMVIGLEEGAEIKKTADSLGTEMSLVAIDRLEKIKSGYAKIPLLKNITFEYVSLLILGNAVYGFWQMPLISEKFLKSDPPHRGAGRYYLAVMENKKEEKKEPFGLYLNKFLRSDKFIAAAYGNRSSETDSILRQINMEDPVANKNIPLFEGEDQKKINELAEIVEPDITAYLERNRTFFIKKYLNSVYKDQVSFREWFVWYYQMMASQAVKTLTEKGFIKNQNAQFILVK